MQTVIKNPNWWRRRTTLERCLTLLSIFALIAVIGLIIGLVSVILANRMAEELKSPGTAPEALHGDNRRPMDNEVARPTHKLGGIGGTKTADVCLTPDCIHTASAVLSKMKPELEPCDDFYQFVCGTYIDEEMIPDDKDSVNTFSLISDKLHEQLKEIITEERSSSEPKHFHLPNALYKACMNKTLIETLGDSPIANIAESLGGWPVIKGDSWDAENAWSWQATVKKFRELGFSMDYIIDFSISVDLKNSTQRIIDFDQSSIGLSREYLVKGFNETLVLAYYDYMVDMAVLFGAERMRAERELKESLEFEMALANISWSNEMRRNTNDLYNIRTLRQLQEEYPYVQWVDYTNALLPKKIRVDENEPVNLSVPSFFEALGPLLQRTPKRVIANYMMWRIHAFSVVFLPEQFRKRQLQYTTALSGRQEQEARWKECVDIASGRRKKNRWWAPDTQKAYLEKAKCIIEQYGNYTDRQTGLNLNGINTQGENIADNGGVKESYKAYHQWVAKNGPEPKLPGLDYTPEQMFWISAGQTWCSKYRKELKSPGTAPEALHGDNRRPMDNEVARPTHKLGGIGGTKTADVCLTPDCIHTASAVLSKMKPELEPCDDFYQFVCGTYIDQQMIPDDKDSLTTFTLVSDKVHEQLKEIITEERSSSEPKHFHLPNALYKACMNKTLIETLGTSPIVNIAESLGGWPVIKGDSWDAENAWSWQATVKKFREVGFSMNYIIRLSIGVDLKNSTQRIIDFDQLSIGLSREYLVKGFNETLVLAYYDYMVDVAVLFGAERMRAERELKESLEFEMALANISWPYAKRRNTNDLYNIRTLRQLQEEYPYVQWVDYTNALLPKKIRVDENEPVNLSVPSFFEALGPLLQRTPKRVIANYMMWRIHAFSVVFMPEQFRKRQLQYTTALSGRQKQEARWKECVDIASGSLAIAVGSLYVRKHFKQDSKAIALEMVGNIRSIFDNMLQEVAWMDEDTKREAKKKLYAMATHIGYPDEMLDNEKLAEYYSKLDIDPQKYYESFLKMNIFGTDYLFNKLRLPVNKTDWVRHARPAVVNAHYSSIENSIQFPAGILQGHFFNAHRPQYMNYGAIGFIIGHEIMHGFDDHGRRFDLQGNLVDWWASDTQKAYLEKAKCIIEQYGNYTDRQTGLNLNGINTQGENIADNGGVKESYKAYHQWVVKNGPEPKLPGLDYTPEQMFWISAGQTWCSKYRKKALKMRITTGVHSPSEFRVFGTFSNMRDFARDFNCPEATPMNPVHKCEVW